ncbi:hypothetical protein Taro_025737 [Colocasia esculenta]|uniref:Transposase MuDR plant domain-containing protein n=1 Tax=Colocasia esculenta TaxID=4460 RepID=A0A843VB02_COLES|nr:hypothetical protein [Colocasia esculenta]
MEKIPARCSFGEDSFVFYVFCGMKLEALRAQIFRRWSLSGRRWIIKYCLPSLTDTYCPLCEDGDVDIMYDIHKEHATNPIIIMRVENNESTIMDPAEKDYRYAHTELTNYAVHRGFDWFYIKNDQSRVTARCKGQGCPWRVHASMLGDGLDFAIKTMNNVHTCGCDLKSQHHPRTSKKWIAELVKKKMAHTPQYRPCDMVKDIASDYGVRVPYHQAWCGREVAV